MVLFVIPHLLVDWDNYFPNGPHTHYKHSRSWPFRQPMDHLYPWFQAEKSSSNQTWYNIESFGMVSGFVVHDTILSLPNFTSSWTLGCQGQSAIFGAVYAQKGRAKKNQRHGLYGFALDQPSVNGIGIFFNCSEKWKRSETVGNGRKRSPCVFYKVSHQYVTTVMGASNR